MKEFSELTNEEVSNLTPSDIEVYKKLAMARAGVKFPVKPEEPKLDNVEPDLRVYTIDGISDRWYGLCFEKIEDARDFVSLLIKAKGISYKRLESYNTAPYLCKGLPLDWQDKAPSLSICSEMVYSKEHYEGSKKSIEKRKKLLAEYDRKKTAYIELLSKANAVTAEIDQRIKDVTEDLNHKKSLTIKFVNDYLPISENQTDIAMKFLEKAYNVSESDKKYIIEHKDDSDFC